MLTVRENLFPVGQVWFPLHKDYYLFLQMMANGGELNGKRIVSSHTVDLDDR